MHNNACSFVRFFVLLVTTSALAGCSTSGGSPDKGTALPDQGSQMMMGGPQSGTGSTGAAGSMGTGQMDMSAMCQMYRNMQNASPEQRQAMLDQQMKGMSPEMRQQHMEMMRQHCK